MQHSLITLVRGGSTVGSAVLVAALVFGAPATAQAQTCTVPSSHLTVQQAIDDPACATVAIAAGVYAENLYIFRSVTLSGAGAGLTILDGSSVNSVVTIWTWPPAATPVTLSGLTIRNGTAWNGGGINSYGATVTISDSVVTGNTGWFQGGGIRNEAALMTIIRSTISNNTMPYNDGAGIRNFGHMVIDSSTISGNSTGGWGGGIAHSGQLWITNSTVSGNTAGWGGAIGSDGHIELNHATIANNTAYAEGASVWQSSLLRTKNSIIAGTSGANEVYLPGGTFVAAGANVSTTSLPGVTTVTMADLALGPLVNNGGSTLTHELLKGSVAIDAASDCSGLSADQRGGARPLGAACDAGAFEAEPPTPLELVAEIADLVASISLPAGDGAPLMESLSAATASLERGNTTAARGQLGAFKNKVSAMVKSRRLSAVNGQALTAAANGVLGGL